MRPVLAWLVVGCCAALDATELTAMLKDSAVTEPQCVSAVEGGAGVIAKHTSLAMMRGWWDCAKEIINAAVKAGVSVDADFQLGSRFLTKQVSALKKELETGHRVQTVSPALEWAQSPDEVFINVKFAHKLDAPATLDVVADNVTISGTALYLYAHRDSKHFELELPLLHEIDSEKSGWQMGSVGRCTFTLKKRQRAKWAKLLSGGKRPANMHPWWTMQEQYEDALDKLEEEAAKAEEEEERAGGAARQARAAPVSEGAAGAAGAAAAGDGEVAGEAQAPGADAESEEARAARELEERKAAAAAEVEAELKAALKAHRRALKGKLKEMDAQKAAAKAAAKKEEAQIKADFEKKKAEAVAAAATQKKRRTFLGMEL